MNIDLEKQKRLLLLSTVKDTLLFLLCEAVASGIIVGAFTLFEGFDFKVVLGTIIGSVATVLNYFIMSISLNSAIDKFLYLRGDREMDEEEAERFTAEHSMKMQATVRFYYIIRMAVMIGALILALVSGWFNPLATVIPLLLFKPILYIIELLGRKGGDK